MNKIGGISKIMEHPEAKIIIVSQEKNALLLASDVSQKWGVDPNYVRELYRRGLLKGIKFSNKTVKFREKEIEDFEIWAEDKNLSNLDAIVDIRTGKIATRKFE